VHAQRLSDLAIKAWPTLSSAGSPNPEQVLSLREAEDYQVEIPNKLAEVEDSRASKAKVSPRSHFHITFKGKTGTKLAFSQAVRESLKLMADDGVSFIQIQEALGQSRLVSVPGRPNLDEMRSAVARMKSPKGTPYKIEDYDCTEEDLFYEDDHTWMLKRITPHRALDRLQRLAHAFPEDFQFDVEDENNGHTT